jgi:hypothetical protein
MQIKRYPKTCPACKRRFKASRPHAVYCSEACSKYAYRQRVAEREEAELKAAIARRQQAAATEQARKVEELRRTTWQPTDWQRRFMLQHPHQSGLWLYPLLEAGKWKERTINDEIHYGYTSNGKDLFWLKKTAVAVIYRKRGLIDNEKAQKERFTRA